MGDYGQVAGKNCPLAESADMCLSQCDRTPRDSVKDQVEDPGKDNVSRSWSYNYTKRQRLLMHARNAQKRIDVTASSRAPTGYTSRVGIAHAQLHT